jgi:hypothetical protein
MARTNAPGTRNNSSGGPESVGVLYVPPPISLRNGDPRSVFRAAVKRFRDELTDVLEPRQEQPLDFAELAEILAPKGINLVKEFEKQVERKMNRGDVAPKEVEKYRKRFETVHVRRGELDQLQGFETPIFFMDDTYPLKAVQNFFKKTGLVYGGDEWDSLKEVNPDTRDFRIRQEPSGFSRLTFCSGIPSKKLRNQGSKGGNSAAAEGHFLRPQQWLEMVQRQIEDEGGSEKKWKDMEVAERNEALTRAYDTSDFIKAAAKNAVVFPDLVEGEFSSVARPAPGFRVMGYDRYIVFTRIYNPKNPRVICYDSIG